jgi:hypothetical protein
MQESSATVPEYLPLNRFARLVQTNRTTLKECVQRGLVQPSAWVGERPLFAVRDLARVVRKIRVDPDNKRLARCTNTALTQARKMKCECINWNVPIEDWL